MKILKAIGLGALGWVLIFFEVSILMFGLKLSAGLNYYLIHFLFLAVLTVALNMIYYIGKKTRGGTVNGIILGIVLVAVGIILDAVITVPLWIIPQGSSYSGFFLDKYMLIGYGIIIVLSGVVGMMKRR